MRRRYSTIAVKAKLAHAEYAQKAALENDGVPMAKKSAAGNSAATNHGKAYSVNGSFHVFRMVGRNATKSTATVMAVASASSQENVAGNAARAKTKQK